MATRAALLVVVCALGLAWMLRSPLDEIQAPPDLVSMSAREWSIGGCKADRGPWHGALVGQNASWVFISELVPQTSEQATVQASITVSEIIIDEVSFDPERVFVWGPYARITRRVQESGGRVLVSIVDDEGLELSIRPYLYDLIGIDHRGGAAFIGSCGAERTAAFGRFALAYADGTGEDVLREILTNPDGELARALRDD